MPLSHLGRLRLTGADVDTFLQGQLSNDLRELRSGHTQLSSWNSAKGRVLALFTGWRENDAVWLETSADLIEPLAKRLKMFVLRAKVAIETPGIRHPAIGLAGDGIFAHLAALGLPVPSAIGEVAAHEGVQLIRRPGGRARFSLHGTQETLEPLWQALALRCKPTGTGAWQLLDILAGQPSITAATQDHFVAQMLNLDTLGGISFNKGCYTGQEVVARLHYLGQLKRRMFLLYASDAGQVAPGTPIHLAQGDTQAVGEVVSVQPHPERGYALLAVLQIAHAQSDALRIGSVSGPPASEVVALVTS
jgi:folate-binding protein YgfZ